MVLTKVYKSPETEPATNQWNDPQSSNYLDNKFKSQDLQRINGGRNEGVRVRIPERISSHHFQRQQRDKSQKQRLFWMLHCELCTKACPQTKWPLEILVVCNHDKVSKGEKNFNTAPLYWWIDSCKRMWTFTCLQKTKWNTLSVKV